MSKTPQADGEIHEDQVLNFLVNTLDEEVDLSLGDNAEIEAEDIYEVLIGACADGTSVSELCETSEDSPHENTVPYHLREKLDLTSVEQVGNALLQKDVRTNGTTVAPANCNGRQLARISFSGHTPDCAQSAKCMRRLTVNRRPSRTSSTHGQR